MKRNQLICYLFLIIFGFSTSQAHAQRWDNIRLFWKGFSSEEYDDTRAIYVGIQQPSISYSNYFFEKASGWNTIPVFNVNTSDTTVTDNLSYIRSRPGWELGFGLPVRVRLNHYISFKSGVFWSVFTGESDENKKLGRRLEFGYKDGRDSVIKMHRHEGAKTTNKSNFKSLDIPLHIQIRSDYKYLGSQSKNTPLTYRLYLLGGVNASRNLEAKGTYDGFDLNNVDAPLMVKPWNFSYEVGLGIDFIFTYFKMSPEFKFTQTMGNILDRDRHKDLMNNGYNPNYGAYMSALDRLGINRFKFSLIFE